MACVYDRSDPDHHESGPVFYCGRVSANFNSRAIGGSRYHFYVTNRNGLRRIFTVARTP